MSSHSPDELLKAINSSEYLIWRHIQRLSAYYMELTNAKNYPQAIDAIKSFRVAASDLEDVLRDLLYRGGCPVGLILNVNAKALKLWNRQVMDGLWMNSSQFYQRFLHAKTQEGKVKELTAFYYLVKDLSDCAQETKVDEYYRAASNIPAE